jgi:hypothetical protein
MVAAGSASAVDLPKTPDLGGLTNLDPGHLGDSVKGTAHGAGQELGNTAGDAVKAGVPTVADAGGDAAGTGVPAAHKALGDLAGKASQTLGSTASTTGDLAGHAASDVHRGMPVSGDGSSTPLGAVSQLPGQLPLSGLTGGAQQKSLPGQAEDRLGGLPGLGANQGGGLPVVGSLPVVGGLTKALPIGG